MTRRLTDRQRAILVALLQNDRRTYRELAAAMGLSSWSTIRGHLDALAELGYVTLGAQGQARSIRLTSAGRAAAGEDAGCSTLRRIPIAAEQTG